MSLFLAWVVFPAILLVLALGAGLTVEALTGARLPGALLVPVGVAAIVVVGGFTTLTGWSADLTTPATVVLAAIGIALGIRGRRLRPDRWCLAAALAAMLVFAAPIVLSGEATFAGYIKLDDTATWLAITDRVMEHGRDLSGLPPSSYEATLAFNLGGGYPIGAFLPLGVGRELAGQDAAWLIQPYMAFLGVVLALGLWELSRPIVRSRALRAAAVFVGAQSALLYGYYLWGGVKEVMAAVLVATFAALAAAASGARLAWRSLIPLAAVTAAVVGALSGAGAIWLVPGVCVALLTAGRALEPRILARRAIALLGGTAALCSPVLIAGSTTPPTSSPLTASGALGNLYHPLDPLQLAGIWPTGDFRLDPSDRLATYALLAAAAIALASGLHAAWRRRAWGPLLYVGGAVGVALAIVAVGSPWVAGKALAIASPAIPFVAMLGAGVAGRRAGRTARWGIGRAVAPVLLAAVAGGVLWSNALAYRDVNLAPRDQLAELERIGGMIAGQGPTLMTEYQPYGVRHFLRDAAPEGASELRRRPVPLIGGGTLPKGATADTDRFQLGAVETYRTLVLRRSPAQSRPPLPFRLVWRGSYYEVWQRPPGAAGPIDHLGLGTRTNPVARPSCKRVRRLARLAGPTGRLLAVPRPPDVVLAASRLGRPPGWQLVDHGRGLLPDGAGTIKASVRIARAGDYEIWLRGSVRPQADLSVDGRPAGSVRGQLENSGEYVRLGEATLGRGRHALAVRFGGADLHPGSGGAPDPVGPLVLSRRDAADTRVVRLDPRRPAAICRRRWDWIEVEPARR